MINKDDLSSKLSSLKVAPSTPSTTTTTLSDFATFLRQNGKILIDYSLFKFNNLNLKTLKKVINSLRKIHDFVWTVNNC
jgi:hypothetical protein